MPASRTRPRLLPALVWFHRWLGIATCLIFAAWFASGAVMLFQPFPSLSHAEQLAQQAPIDGRAVLVTPAAAVRAAGGDATGLRLVQRGGRPAYVVDAADGAPVIDATTGLQVRPVSRSQAMAEARRLFGATARVAGPFDYDQWVVHNRFDAARPFYRLDAGDSAGTQLYLSSRTGELLQRTTRSARAWSWVGTVLHWVYLTPLRKNWSAWDRSVWWLSLVCMAVAVAGTILGIARMLAARLLNPPRITFYRARWLRWHHLLGMGTAVFVLGWIFSGWLSMDHGRLFSRGTATPGQAERYAGCSLREALATVGLGSVRVADGTRELAFTAVACGPVLARYAGTGVAVRFSGDGTPIGRPAMEALVARAVKAGWPAASRVQIADIDPLTTYARAEGWPASAWLVRLNPAPLPQLAIDGDTGRLLTILDDSRAAYAWVYYALHTGNVPGLVTHPTLRRLLLLLPLTAGFLFSLTGVVIGWRRLRRTKRLAQV